MDIVERLKKRKEIIIAANPNGVITQVDRDAIEAADEIERLRKALAQIRDFGPMTVDDQRWRVANAALQQKESEQ